MLQKHNKNSKTITKKHIFVIASTILSTIAFFLLSSCGEQTDSPNIEMQITTFFNASNFSNTISQNKQLDNTVQKAVGCQQYIKNIAQLDKLLSVSSGNDENCKEYMERIDTNYLFTTDFSNNCGGGLQAWHNENGVCAYRLIMETPNKVDVFENVSEHRDDILMQDGVLMSYYWNDLYYKCNDIVQQHTINSKIWEIEYEILENIEKQFPAVKEMSMCIKPTFYNARMVSGYFEIRMQKQKENSRKTREIPIMVDKQSGELITVKELIPKQAFLEIFDNWAADAVAIGKLAEEEGAFCREKIEQCWEYGETLENYFGEKESFLSFWFEQKGVKIGIYPQKKDVYRPVYYTIDKEYFFATPLWKYLEPEYQIAGKEY